MITLTVNNSLSKVEGLNDAQFRALRDILSYTDGEYFGGRPPAKRYLIDKKGCFPTGLLSKVEEFLKDTPHRVDDVRRVPEPQPGMFVLRLENIRKKNKVAA